MPMHTHMCILYSHILIHARACPAFVVGVHIPCQRDIQCPVLGSQDRSSLMQVPTIASTHKKQFAWGTGNYDFCTQPKQRSILENYF